MDIASWHIDCRLIDWECLCGGIVKSHSSVNWINTNYYLFMNNLLMDSYGTIDPDSLTSNGTLHL